MKNSMPMQLLLGLGLLIVSILLCLISEWLFIVPVAIVAIATYVRRVDSANLSRNDGNRPAEHEAFHQDEPRSEFFEDERRTSTGNTTKDSEIFYPFEEFEDDYILAYVYEPRIAFPQGTFDEILPHIIGNSGKALEFVPEPDNTFDDKAIAIYLDSKKIGYVRRGGIQDMIHDCIKRNWRFRGYLNKYSVEEKTASYKIASYKPCELCESKKFPLIKTRKRLDDYFTRADNLLICEIGEVLSVEEDDAEGAYIVYSSRYDEIGELPKRAVLFLEDNADRNPLIVLDELEDDDDGYPNAKIKIYLKNNRES